MPATYDAGQTEGEVDVAAEGAGRIERAQESMAATGVDLLLVGPSADLRYLIGYHALALERLTLLVVPADGEAQLVVPELEVSRARTQRADEHATIHAWAEHEDPMALVHSLVGGTRGATYAVQDRLWASFLLQLQERLDPGEWVAASQVMRELRIRKDADEVAALRDAGKAIDAVHARIPELLRPGRTEREVGRDISELILEDHDEVNFVIVASGPNGASPHHETGERTIEDGDAVVIDIGGTRRGYCSDMTRNYVVGRTPEAYRELHDVLLAAQRAAVEAVRPGVSAEDVDRAARSVITDAGFGEQFLHRTGHGIGIEEHEEPWIVAGNDLELEPGMAFSVEPGIYVEGRYGARIEDIVVVTDDGVERLNTLDRELVEVAS
ncbi:MAG: Xaa-Pro peptidase family protein [Nitriliruptorales bacterium]|nr:Xaa-Pro peptidase family protein [Nitriliruptorales bacterium]